MVFDLIDLTQTLRDGFITYGGKNPGLRVERLRSGSPEGQLSRFSLFDPHCGTHLDAPRHFVSAGKDVAELPLLILPACVVAAQGSTIGREAFARSGPLRGHAVLIQTGWDAHAGTSAYYHGYPYPTREAALWLVEQGIALLGLDTPSADGMPDPPEFPVHETVLGAGIPIVEGLVNLSQAARVKGDLFFLGFPLKLAGVEGSPIRAVGMVVRR